MKPLSNFFFILVAITTLVMGGTVAQAATGGIIPGFHKTKVCHDATCGTPAPGILNFRPTGAAPVVVDGVTGLSGNVWGNELGWITLNPTGEGVVFADQNTGLLTGKAWSQVSGWINFAPTGQGVTINPQTGEFSGWAWTGGPYGGWISFDCSSPSTCIKTDWGQASSGNSSGGGASGGNAPDVCPNLPGRQGSLPSGYTVDDSGACITISDACPNIAGIQTAVPNGFSLNSIGACVLTVDYCPNIAGMQLAVPQGYVIGVQGRCVAVVTDVCPDMPGIQTEAIACTGSDVCDNLFGVQTAVPQGYQAIGASCVPAALDMCPNIEGAQAAIPEGMTILSGDCVPLPADRCANLAGVQTAVPNGFFESAGNCFFGERPTDTAAEQRDTVIAFSFIPRALQVPSDHPFLRMIVNFFGNPKTQNFTVDVVSSIVVAGLGAFLLFLIIRFIRAVR